MQIIYRWAFAVAPTLCPPPLAPTLKSGGARAPSWIYSSGTSGLPALVGAFPPTEA